MLLDNFKEIQISELIKKLAENNKKILLYCSDSNPNIYITYNVSRNINVVTCDFSQELSKVNWMKETFSGKSADICIIENINENTELLNTLINIIKTGQVDNEKCDIKQWVLFTSDLLFISDCDTFIQNFECYKLLTEEVLQNRERSLSNEDDFEFQNETGHTEDTEELVEGYELFDESNIVTEEVFQVRFENDEYRSGDVVDVNGIVREFNTVDNLTKLLSANACNAGNDKTIVATLSDGKTPKNTIEAAVGLIGAVNDFGHYITRGCRCPVCGKYVKYLPSNGYCSITCAGKHLLTKIGSCLTGEYKVDTPKIIEQIQNIMDYFNIAFNIISKMPDLLASIVKLPEDYKNYATAKINLIFLELKKIINLLLIKKNELIVYLLSKIKYGIIDDKMQNLFSVIESILKTAEALREKLEESLTAAYKAITKASGQFYIGPQEYGFFTTLKSQMCLCPYFKTDIYTYPSDQLGKPYWGSGIMNIAFDMSLCQYSLEEGAKSALRNTNFKKITNAIRKVFKPITTPEYLMDPDLFDVRLALSDQNYNGVQSLTNFLSKTMVFGGDFIPEYENLSLTNIWFIIAILTCWGPWTREIYGDFIYHAWL